MPDGVFLDTVGLLALLNRDDDHHQQAAVVFREIGDQRRNVITTQLVLSELGNGLARSPLRSDAVWLIQAIMTDRAATIV